MQVRGWPASSDGPTLSCVVHGQPPLPAALPTIAWRGGIDLNPLDVQDTDAMAWLTNLVWPEQEDRRLRLEAAITIARHDPPHPERGNILTDLRKHVDVAAQFQSLLMELVEKGVCRWVSNEGKKVLPEITATGPSVPVDRPTFVLALDGQALAWTHGHGASLTWL